MLLANTTRGTLNCLNSSMRKSMYNRIIPTNTTMNATVVPPPLAIPANIIPETATQPDDINGDAQFN